MGPSLDKSSLEDEEKQNKEDKYDFQPDARKKIEELKNRINNIKNMEDVAWLWADISGDRSLKIMEDCLKQMADAVTNICNNKKKLKSYLGKEKYKEFTDLFHDFWVLLGETNVQISTFKQEAERQHKNIENLTFKLKDNDNNQNEQIEKEYRDRFSILSKWMNQDIAIKNLKVEWNAMIKRIAKMQEECEVKTSSWTTMKWIFGGLATAGVVACLISMIAVAFCNPLTAHISMVLLGGASVAKAAAAASIYCSNKEKNFMPEEAEKFKEMLKTISSNSRKIVVSLEKLEIQSGALIKDYKEYKNRESAEIMIGGLEYIEFDLTNYIIQANDLLEEIKKARTNIEEAINE